MRLILPKILSSACHTCMNMHLTGNATIELRWDREFVTAENIKYWDTEEKMALWSMRPLY